VLPLQEGVSLLTDVQTTLELGLGEYITLWAFVPPGCNGELWLACIIYLLLQ